MTKINVNDTEVNVLDNLNEINLGQYIEMVELNDKSDTITTEEFILKFIPIISDTTEEFLSEMFEEDLIQFVEVIDKFNASTLRPESVTHFNLNGNIYSYNNVNKLTMGEKISIKLLEKKAFSIYENWLNLLAIIVRPAVSKTDEFGATIYDVEKFKGDIEIIEKRKEIFKSIPASNALYITRNFTNGSIL